MCEWGFPGILLGLKEVFWVPFAWIWEPSQTWLCKPPSLVSVQQKEPQEGCVEPCREYHVRDTGKNSVLAQWQPCLRGHKYFQNTVTALERWSQGWTRTYVWVPGSGRWGTHWSWSLSLLWRPHHHLPAKRIDPTRCAKPWMATAFRKHAMKSIFANKGRSNCLVCICRLQTQGAARF